MVGSLDAALALLDEALDAVAAFEPGVEHAEQVMRARNRMEAVATRCTRRVELSGALDGAISTASWLAWRTRIKKSAAKAMVANGRALGAMPDAASAFDAGEITGDHVRELARAQRFAPTAFPKAEAELLDDARRCRFDVFARRVRYFEQLAEPDRVEERAREVHETRRLHASRGFEDTVVIGAILDPVGGSVYMKELQRIEQQLFEDDWADARERLGDAATAQDLRRTPAQRRADAQVLMAIRSAAMPADARPARILLTVLVGYETVHGRICELADGTVVTPGQVVPWLTDADVERAVFGPEGRVIDLGRRSRLFVGGTRRAVELSDLECTEASCDIRHERCDVDHTIPWAAGGPTDRANGRVRCPHHNPGRRRRPRPPG